MAYCFQVMHDEERKMKIKKLRKFSTTLGVGFTIEKQRFLSVKCHASLCWIFCGAPPGTLCTGCHFEPVPSLHKSATVLLDTTVLPDKVALIFHSYHGNAVVTYS